mgnify:CR=1 FL=1
MSYSGKLNFREMQKRLLVEIFYQPGILGREEGGNRTVQTLVGDLDLVDATLLGELGLSAVAQQSGSSGVPERSLKNDRLPSTKKH